MFMAFWTGSMGALVVGLVLVGVLILAAKYYRKQIADLLARGYLPPDRRPLLSLVEGLPGIAYRCSCDEDWTMHYISAGCREITGCPPEAFLERKVTFASLIHPQDRLKVRDAVERAVAREEVFHLEYRLVRADGGTRWLFEKGSGARGPHGQLEFLEGFIHDITPLKQAQIISATERERLAVTVESLADGVLSVNVSGQVLLANSAVRRLLQVTEERLVGQPIEKVLSLEETGAAREAHPAWVALLKGEQVIRQEATLVLQTWETLAVSLNATPVKSAGGEVLGAVLLVQDETQRRQAVEERLALRNLDALGILAGGLAHNYNNLLTVALGSLALARNQKGDPEDRVESLAVVEKSLLDARELTRQLLTFSRGGSPILRRLDLRPLLQRVVEAEVAQHPLTVVWDVQEDLFLARVDEGQITEALRQIVRNAVQAMMPQGGVLRLVMQNQQEAIPGLMTQSDCAYICILVVDEGGGIQEENLGRIFYPYFSTKPGASGLGLSAAYSIVVQHGGSVAVQSKAGRGTTFVLRLPSAPPLAGRISPASAGAGLEEAPFRDRRVLVVDDEVAILRVAAAMLVHMGCVPSIAASGKEAASLYQQALNNGQPYHAVLLDLTMPCGWGGKETLDYLRKIDPEVCAIVSSGYFHDPIMASYREHGFRAVVPKPYGLEDMQRVLREVWAVEENCKEKLPSG